MIQLTREEFAQVAQLLPKPRANEILEPFTVLNACLYILSTGSTWRSLPAEYGTWTTVYNRLLRWEKSGLLTKVFMALQAGGILNLHVTLTKGDSILKRARGFFWTPTMNN